MGVLRLIALLFVGFLLDASFASLVDSGPFDNIERMLTEKMAEREGTEAAEVGSHPLGVEIGSESLKAGQRDIEMQAGVGMHTRERKESSTASQADSHELAFQEFVKKHKRSYELHSPEFMMRQAIFKKRLEAVHSQNSLPNPRWKASVTRYSDFTDAERAVMRGYKGRGATSQSASFLEENARETLAETVDWRHLQVANHIPNQGGCGSCWAIATTSMLEAHYEIHVAKNGQIRTFSAQQTLECTPNPRECGGKGGCEGATVELGIAWIMEHGLATEEEVPYLALDGKCEVSDGKSHSKGNDDFQVLERHANTPSLHGGAAFGLIGWRTLAQNEDYPLAAAVAKLGPVAVSAAASDWFEYSSGIFDSCPQDAIVDHAITLYGYGKDDAGTKYWLIRNSWGSEWGEKGFIRLLRHDDGRKHCGTDNNPSEGLGCKGGPPSVTVCGMCGILYDSVVPHFAGSLGVNKSSMLAKTPQSSTSSDNMEWLDVPKHGLASSLMRREVSRHESPP